jgi:hypothetical protein
MLMIVLIIILLLAFGGGGGYYGYQRWGTGGGVGIFGLVHDHSGALLRVRRNAYAPLKFRGDLVLDRPEAPTNWVIFWTKSHALIKEKYENTQTVCKLARPARGRDPCRVFRDGQAITRCF